MNVRQFMVDWYRQIIRIHYTLMPYFYNSTNVIRMVEVNVSCL